MPVAWAGQPAVERRTMCGAVRTAIRTREAPPSARSAAISAPVLPTPTTRTSRSAYGAGLRYRAACRSSPVYVSRPGQSGTRGVWLKPVATTTARPRRTRPPVAVSCQSPEPSGAGSTRVTSTPVTTSSSWCSVYFSRYRTRSSRPTQRPNLRGIFSPGSADQRRVVCRCSRS